MLLRAVIIGRQLLYALDHAYFALIAPWTSSLDGYVRIINAAIIILLLLLL